jgi:tetratricopeptide (TPR) repeat protein
MPDLRPEELIRAEKLYYNAKFEDALELITRFEKKADLNPKDQISSLILKGRIYASKGQHSDAIKMGEEAYQLSQKFRSVSESIDALLLIINKIFLGNYYEALELTLKAEKLLYSVADKSLSDFSSKKASILYAKSWIYNYKGDFNKALELALECLELREKISVKLNIANTFLVLGYISINKGEFENALEYGMKCLKLHETLDNRYGIATGLALVGFTYNFKGRLDQAVKYCKQSLSMDVVSGRTKTHMLYTLGVISAVRGEIDRALKYSEQSLALAEEDGIIDHIALNTWQMGSIYVAKGNIEKALAYFKRRLTISEKIGYSFVSGMVLLALTVRSLDANRRIEAQQYLARLEELSIQNQGRFFTHVYLVARAYNLQASGRTRDRAEAEGIWRQIINDKISNPVIYISSLGAMCEFLIDELYISNDTEILEELNPAIDRLLNITEKTHSYSWLAYTKLLKAKLALIELNIEEGKKLMTQAQRVAELHGLSRLAQRISNEHDNLLEQVHNWDNLRSKDAPIAERIKLASVNGVIDQMQGRGVIQTPENVEEEPVLLLIAVKGGVLLFSYPFAEEWKFDDDLFSGFLNSFSSISDEIFSEGLDRAKFGQYTVLMNSIGDFSVCYLFKGQSYLALQKLTDFSRQIQDKPNIWQTLEKFYKTSQVLEIKDIPPLESIITETFISKNPELIE